MNEEEFKQRAIAAGYSPEEVEAFLAKKRLSVGDEIHDGAASFLQGATMGLGGHIDPEMKRASDEFSQHHKILSKLTGTAGAVTGALAIPAAWGVTRLGRALIGGGAGAVAAGAEGDGTLEDRAKRAAVGGVTGAAAGVAIPELAGVAGKIVKRLAQPLRNPADIVAEATGPLLPDEASAMLARQEHLAPGTAVPAGMSPELPAATRVIGANPRVAFEAERASALRTQKIDAALGELSNEYKQVLAPNGKAIRAPLDMGDKANIRKVIIDHGMWPGDETIEAQAVQSLRNDIDGKIKALKIAVRQGKKGGPQLHRLGEQKKALTQWLEEVAPGIRSIDKDYGVLSRARRTEDAVVKNLKQSRKAYASSRAAGIEPGSPGASLPTRGGLFHTLVHPDRPKLAEAVNKLLLQPGQIPQELLEARARSQMPPRGLYGTLPFLSGAAAGYPAGLLFDQDQ